LIWVDRWKLIIIVNTDFLLDMSVRSLVEWLALDIFVDFCTPRILCSLQSGFLHKVHIWLCVGWFCARGCGVVSTAFDACIWFCTVSFGVSMLCPKFHEIEIV
jgi:hypothetical protein